MNSFTPDKIGNLGWIGLAIGVVAFDFLSSETLSHAFSRYPRAARVGSVALLGLHLMDALPSSLDPIDGLARLVGKHT